MRYKILHSFKFAHRGVQVTEYAKGDEVDVEDPEFGTVAVREGWAEAIDGAKPKKKGKPADSED